MKKLVLLILLLLLMAPATRAEALSQLLEEPEAFDGKEVSFRGEVIGVLIRDNHAWVNMFENGVAIGVWCRAEEARLISFIGDYTHRGDMVEVVGIYHMTCLEHGGDMDIHALSLQVLERGHQVERPLDLTLVLLSVVITAAAVVVSYYLWHIRKEMRKRVPWPFY